MANFFFNKININLDNYYLNPHKFKFCDDNSSNICFQDSADLNEIIQTLTSIIMSNKDMDYLKNNPMNLDSNLENNKDIISNNNIKNFNLTNNILTENKLDKYNLFKLVANNNIKQLEHILKNDNSVNINIQDEDGDTPLHLSVFLCNFKACEILILGGSLLNIKDKWGQIPIHRLCFCSDKPKAIKIISLFDIYQKKINLNNNIFNSLDNYGNTPFHLLLNYLIKNNISINVEHMKIINKLKKLTNNKISNKNGQTIMNLFNLLNI